MPDRDRSATQGRTPRPDLAVVRQVMTSAQKLLLVLIAGIATGVATPAGVVTGAALAICFASLALLAADRPPAARVCLALAAGALALAYGAAARAAVLAPPLTRWAGSRRRRRFARGRARPCSRNAGV